MHLPIGVSDFRKLAEYKDPTGKGYLFVDKTALIKDIIYDLTKVIVIIRPRRFGKILNLSMLQHFFAANVDGLSTTGLFTGLEISKDPLCMQHQGKYPVIFLTLKDTKADTFDSAINKVYEIIRQVYEQHRYVIADNKLSQEEINFFISIVSQTATIDKLAFALYNLTYYIYKTSGQKVYILIDEYDTPIQSSYTYGYYDKFISFIKGLLGSALKGNINIRQAILTGILRVSKESLFSDLNNVEIYSVLNDNYCAKYFGFTENEVNDLLAKTKLPLDLKLTKEWYNGYNFGGITIYNPWSIIKFIKEKGLLMSYWVNTSGNEMIKNLIINSEPVIKEQLQALMAGNIIQAYIDEHIAFNDLTTNKAAAWSLLLMSGYLTAVSKQPQGNCYLCELAIPNKEIAYFYNSVVENWLAGARGPDWYQEFLDDLRNGRVVEFEEKLQTLIEETLSYHDVTTKSQESFYHGLMLSFVSGLKETHEIKSNKESGKGRYDVAIIPRDSSKLGIIMEFKATLNEHDLELEAKEALEQIKRSRYIAELKSRGVVNICQLGLAFSGKSIKAVTEKV